MSNEILPDQKTILDRLEREVDYLHSEVERLNDLIEDEYEAARENQPSLFGTLLRVAGLVTFGYWLGGGFEDD